MKEAQRWIRIKKRKGERWRKRLKGKEGDRSSREEKEAQREQKTTHLKSASTPAKKKEKRKPTTCAYILIIISSIKITWYKFIKNVFSGLYSPNIECIQENIAVILLCESGITPACLPFYSDAICDGAKRLVFYLKLNILRRLFSLILC